MLERLRVYEGADQIELFGPVSQPPFYHKALSTLLRWFGA